MYQIRAIGVMASGNRTAPTLLLLRNWVIYGITLYRFATESLLAHPAILIRRAMCLSSQCYHIIMMIAHRALYKIRYWLDLCNVIKYRPSRYHALWRRNIDVENEYWKWFQAMRIAQNRFNQIKILSDNYYGVELAKAVKDYVHCIDLKWTFASKPIKRQYKYH